MRTEHSEAHPTRSTTLRTENSEVIRGVSRWLMGWLELKN